MTRRELLQCFVAPVVGAAPVVGQSVGVKVTPAVEPGTRPPTMDHHCPVCGVLGDTELSGLSLSYPIGASKQPTVYLCRNCGEIFGFVAEN